MRIKLSDSVFIQPKLFLTFIWSLIFLLFLFVGYKQLRSGELISALLFSGLGAICSYFFIPWGFHIEYDDDFLYVFKSGSEVKVPLENIKRISCSWVPIGVRSFNYYYFNFIYIAFDKEIEGMKKITFIKQPDFSFMLTNIKDFKFYNDFDNKINIRKKVAGRI